MSSLDFAMMVEDTHIDTHLVEYRAARRRRPGRRPALRRLPDRPARRRAVARLFLLRPAPPAPLARRLRHPRPHREGPRRSACRMSISATGSRGRGRWATRPPTCRRSASACTAGSASSGRAPGGPCRIGRGACDFKALSAESCHVVTSAGCRVGHDRARSCSSGFRVSLFRRVPESIFSISCGGISGRPGGRRPPEGSEPGEARPAPAMGRTSWPNSVRPDPLRLKGIGSNAIIIDRAPCAGDHKRPPDARAIRVCRVRHGDLPPLADTERVDDQQRENVHDHSFTPSRHHAGSCRSHSGHRAFG